MARRLLRYVNPMRALLLSLCLGLALAACGPLTAKKFKTDPRLDPLFEQLKQAPDAAAAQQVEARIWRIWGESGSATVDILLERAQAAEAAGDAQLARSFLDQAVQILPDYAEAYNRRAVIAFDGSDTAAALADIEDALEREPRHFGALAGLGMIYESLGQKRAAYEAYKSALEIDPFLDQAKQGAARLKPEVDGREA
jgi:tetratricopeptide (TPR) repeat protein